MPLSERVYSVLLVSASQSFNAALSGLLPASVFDPVVTVSDVGAAKRAYAEQSFDVVIVNSPLPDDTGVRFAADVSSGSRTVALLLLRADFYEEVTAAVSPHGVFTASKPVPKALMESALSWLVSGRERLRKTEKKTLSLEEKMEEIRLVNRAKWLLIETCGMDEPAAHRYIEKAAMDRCVTRRAVAEELLGEEKK